MSKTKLVTAGLILIAVVIILLIITPKKQSGFLPSPTSTPAPTPKTFKFDSSTDLKKELESISPQVLDSDFEEVR